MSEVNKETVIHFKKLLAPAIPFAVIDWTDDEASRRKLDNLTFVLNFSQVVVGFVTTIDDIGGRHMQLPPRVKWKVMP